MQNIKIVIKKVKKVEVKKVEVSPNNTYENYN